MSNRWKISNSGKYLAEIFGEICLDQTPGVKYPVVTNFVEDVEKFGGNAIFDVLKFLLVKNIEYVVSLKHIIFVFVFLLIFFLVIVITRYNLSLHS